MKSLIYILSILALGYATELKCDDGESTTPSESIQLEEVQAGSFWANINNLYEQTVAILYNDYTKDAKNLENRQISKQEFDLLVRKHILEQKDFLRYMQATSISLTFLMVAITTIMCAALKKNITD